MALDKHLFQAGRFDLLELLELGGVFGNQRVEGAEVGADFLLFGFLSRKENHCSTKYGGIYARHRLPNSSFSHTLSCPISRKFMVQIFAVDRWWCSDTENPARKEPSILFFFNVSVYVNRSDTRKNYIAMLENIVL